MGKMMSTHDQFSIQIATNNPTPAELGGVLKELSQRTTGSTTAAARAGAMMSQPTVLRG